MSTDCTPEDPWWYSEPLRDPGDCVWEESESVFQILTHDEMCRAIGLGEDDWPGEFSDAFGF